jgi:cell division inhibitor SulA
MNVKKLFDSRGILTQEGMETLSNTGPSVSCECPQHLVELLAKVKEFTEYQENCLVAKPSDQLTHQWLKSTSINLEHLLSSTILNLARMEGIIDENNNIIE